MILRMLWTPTRIKARRIDPERIHMGISMATEIWSK